MKLNHENIPQAVSTLLPIVLRWGINDDYTREKEINSASTEDLLNLVKSLESIDYNILYEWLEGPESFKSSPSIEYVAFTNYTMAIDSAKIKLKKRGIQI